MQESQVSRDFGVIKWESPVFRQRPPEVVDGSVKTWAGEVVPWPLNPSI